jgi:protein-S-isoprenylcysteine O-methyltransferase Ste14
MTRFAVLIYGVLCYLVFLATFLYAVGFVGDLAVPRSVDTGLGVDASRALWIDVVLLGLFAVPHSVMARQGFKAWWVRIIPQPVERSTYVLASSLLLALLLWQWRPLPAVVWEVNHPVGRGVLYALFGTGWCIALWATFLIDHFDLFGLRQVYLYFRGLPSKLVGFKTPALYRLVRHPLILGFLIAFWATPRMTAGHLLFAAAMTVYSLVAIKLEERDLVVFHGEAYRDYQRQVGMFWPRRLFRSDERGAEATRDVGSGYDRLDTGRG